MTFDEVCSHLTKDPFHYTLAEVGELTPFQVRRILFRPRKGDEWTSSTSAAASRGVNRMQ